MEKQSNKTPDFSGQNIYVGMDVNHKNWKIHIYNEEFELKSLSLKPDVDRYGDLNFVHVPYVDLELDRQLLRIRGQLTKDSTRLKNRIKAALKLQGIEIPVEYKEGSWSKAFMEWLLQIAFNSISG